MKLIINQLRHSVRNIDLLGYELIITEEVHCTLWS